MILYLIRHGQTDINKENKIQGRHGLPLNETGINQAITAQKKLKDVKFDLVFSSPQIRAIQTAEIATGIKPTVDKRLDVYDIGSAENLYLDEVKFVNDMIPDPTLYSGVENTTDYISRVFDFVDEIVDKYKNQNCTIFISGHSCTTGCISAYFQGFPEDGNFLKLSAKNAEFKVIEI